MAYTLTVRLAHNNDTLASQLNIFHNNVYFLQWKNKQSKTQYFFCIDRAVY
jgi:hypothetical protein